MEGVQRATSGGPPPALDCDEAAARLRLHAECALPAGQVGELRAHLVACAPCAALFRGIVEQRARLARALRGQPPAPARLSPSAQPARAAGGPGVGGAGTRGAAAPAAAGLDDVPPDPQPARPSDGPRGRRFRLRLIVLPAIMIWFVIEMWGVPSSSPRIQVLEVAGEVFVAGRAFEEYESPPLLRRGAWCITAGRSAATLQAPGARLRLAAGTHVQAEDAVPLRVRLRAGELELAGTATVVTALGLVELEEGAGHLSLRAGELELRCDGGRMDYLGPFGERTLRAGERAVIGL